MLVFLVATTSACGKNNSEDLKVEVTAAVANLELEQSSLLDSVEEDSIETTTNKEGLATSSSEDDLVMYYDVEKVTIEGKKLVSSDAADYEFNKLIPVEYYEQSDIKLYAYKLEYGENEGKGVTYSLLLEHNGVYQVFDKTEDLSFDNMFEYEDDLYDRSFNQGYEQDFDNDNETEMAKVIVQNYGTMILESAMVVFEFNSDTEKYDCYYINGYELKDTIGKAAELFFDKYYDSYSINKYGEYEFNNGYVVNYGSYIGTRIDKDGVFLSDVWLFGNPWGDGGIGNEIGSITLKVGYEGNGIFSVKAESYREWVNIME